MKTRRNLNWVLGLVLLFASKTSLAQCDADFTTSIDTNTNTVSFFYTDTNINVTHTWRIDQFETNQRLRTYVIPNAGTYNITHIVSDSVKMCTDSAFGKVVVISTLQCYAKFTAVETSDGKVALSNLGIGNSFTWLMGDGTILNGPQPTHQYTDNREFLLCMVAQSANRSCSDTACQYVVIQTADTTGCNASFSSLNLSRDSIQFKAEQNGYQQYSWSFGDDSTGQGESIIHQFKDTGTYNVCLTIFNSRLNCFDTICKIVTIFPAVQCRADFRVIKVSDDSVRLIPDEQNHNLYLWRMGNGDSLFTKFPNYSYKKPGSYQVCLEIVDSINNCRDTSCQTVSIDIKPNCIARFNVGLDTTIKNVLFLINRSTNRTTHLYRWTFGDGSFSVSRKPTHTYQEHKAYEICLEITDNSLGCEDRYCDTVGLDENGKLLKNGAFELVVLDFEDLGDKPFQELEGVVYPNPTQKRINIDLPQSAQTTILFTDISGKELYNREEVSNRFEIDVSKWTRGIYILKILQENKMMTKKIMVY